MKNKLDVLKIDNSQNADDFEKQQLKRQLDIQNEIWKMQYPITNKNQKSRKKEARKLDTVVENINSDFDGILTNANVVNNKARVLKYNVWLRFCLSIMSILVAIATYAVMSYCFTQVHYYNYINFNLRHLPKVQVQMELSLTGEFEGEEQMVFDNLTGGVVVGGIDNYVENIVDDTLKLIIPADEKSLGSTLYFRVSNWMTIQYAETNLEIDFANGPALSVSMSAYNSIRTITNIKYYDGISLYREVIELPIALTGESTPIDVEFGIEDYK